MSGFLPYCCFAADPILLNDVIDKKNLETSIEYIEDSHKKISIADIINFPHRYEFVDNIDHSINFGYSASAYWLRLPLMSTFKKSKEWLLEVGYPGLDQLDFYYILSNGEIVHKKGGDQHPFDQREINHRHVVFSFESNPEHLQHLYLRVEGSGSLQIPLTLWSRAAFMEDNFKVIGFWGLYYGLLIAIAIYNLVMLFSTKEKSYLIYVIYVVFWTLTSSILNGLGFQCLWPQYPAFNQLAPFFLAFTTGLVNLFTIRFLQTKTQTPIHHLVLSVATVLLFFSGILSIFLNYRMGLRLVVFQIIMTGLILLSTVLRSVLNRYRLAIYYLIAWLFFIVGCLITAISGFGILPSNFITLHAGQVGAGMQVILLSFGFTYNINLIRVEKERAQEVALENEQMAVENLKKADKLKDEFLANTSHELKTPLNGIIGIAETLMDGAAGNLNQKMHQDLSLIASSGKRLSGLVNELLDFSKIKHGEFELNPKPIDIRTLSDIVVMIMKPMVGNKPVTLNNKIPPEMPLVHADENRLHQIMMNLIGNAIKYTESGKIEISAEPKHLFLHIHVSDTGTGIQEKRQSLIFEPFEQGEDTNTRLFDGFGLGLAITKKLVHLHGGDITVDAKENRGSTFSFTLPITDQNMDNSVQTKVSADLLPNWDLMKPIDDKKDDLPSMPDEMVYDSTDTTIHPQHILLVDDDPVNLQVMKNHLLMLNMSITTAKDGSRALDLITRHPFDIVLLDVMMPRLSGIDVCKEIRKTYSANDLPIIMVTAKNFVSDLVAALEAGANDFITKPVTKNELLSRVKTSLKLKKVYQKHVTLENQYRMLLENLNVGVLRITGDNNQILHANRAAITLFGYTASDEFFHAPFYQFFEDEDEQNHLMEKIRENKGFKNIEIKMKNKDHTPMLISGTVTPEYDPKGNMAAIDYVIEDITEKRRLLREIETTRINLLQQKINPHFLLNALNSVYTLIDEDVERADKAILMLSEMYRYLLDKSSRQTISFMDEWQFVNNYIQLQQISLDGLITVNMKIKGEFQEATIPPLTLQPIVENAFKHGFKQRADKFCISVIAEKKNERIFVTITDDGMGLQTEDIYSRSLGNIQKRLKYYHEGADLQVENRETEGVQVTLSIPG